MANVLKKNKTKGRKTKRGGRKFRHKTENLVIFSTNSAGLKSKADSLKNEVNTLKAAIFTIQETHFKKKGKFKMPNYEIFEAIRSKTNGGTMIGAHKALKPMLVSEYSEDFELLVVEIQVRNKEIRVISGYGPQESWAESQRIPFFIALESEIVKAEMTGKSLIIEMDSNSKLGPEYIPNDPHVQTPNGRLLAGIMERHGLIVANGLADKCTGLITRKRITKKKTETAVLDFFVVCTQVLQFVDRKVIDEEKQYVLSNYSSKGVTKRTAIITQ